MRDAVRRRPEDCALALSTDAAAEGVIKMAVGRGSGMNASLGLGEQHPGNFTRTLTSGIEFCQLLGLQKKEILRFESNWIKEKFLFLGENERRLFGIF